MYIRRLENVNSDFIRHPIRDLQYLAHLMKTLNIVANVKTHQIHETQERVVDFTLNEVDVILKLLEKSHYENFPVYVIYFPDEAIPKQKYDAVSLNEKLSRLKQTLSSLNERAELSFGGLIDLVG